MNKNFMIFKYFLYSRKTDLETLNIVHFKK